MQSLRPGLDAGTTIRGLRVLYVGELWDGATSLQRMRAMQRLGVEVIAFDSSSPEVGLPRRVLDGARRRAFRAGLALQSPPDRENLNLRLLSAASRATADLVWIDKGTVFRRSTLRAVRNASRLRLLIGYSLDDMAGRHNQTACFLESLAEYDYFVTTKSFGVSELRSLGAREVLFVNNAFDPVIHRVPPDGCVQEFQIKFGFVGAYERDRFLSLRALARDGHDVRIVGPGRWPSIGCHPRMTFVRNPLWADSYSRSIWQTQVNLGFLRKCNRDLQTTRSIEIPACGGFMLAERTDEHLALFREGVEAEFFSSVEELLDKARFYEGRPELCRHIGAAGRARCERGGYSYDDQISGIFRTVLPAQDGERNGA